MNYHDAIAQKNTEITRLRAELEAARRDAAQWKRLSRTWETIWASGKTNDEINAALAAMKGAGHE